MAKNIHLPYTLRTTVGMVLNSGLPTTRSWYQEDNADADLPVLQEHLALQLAKLDINTTPKPRLSFREQWAKVVTRSSTDPPHICRYQDYAETDWSSEELAPVATTAISCITTGQRLATEPATSNEALHRLATNINACRNPRIDIYRLITFIRMRARLDLEQAAAAVVSALVSDGRTADAAVLLRELTGVLSVTDMRVPADELLVRRNTLARGQMAALASFGGKVYSWCKRRLAAAGAEKGAALTIGAEPPRTWEGLVRLLVRVRSERPAEKNRCLYIPRRMYETAGVVPEGGHAEFLDGYVAEMEAKGGIVESTKGYEFPKEERHADSIVLSKHCFRVVQKQIFRLFPFWNRAVCLRRNVRQLEDKVLYAGGWIDKRLRETEDVALVAHWFFGFQRRLQLKVVSNDKWTRFLEKGEGAKLYQNNLRLKSTFESALAQLAGQTETETLSTGDDTLGLMDETCLLMKEYVDVYGDGKKERLVFSRGGVWGVGRGSVDEYNMLCDILKELRLRAKDEGLEKVPGPVYKFLAKDIMHWNDSWGDDAFAGGKVHGWEDWIQERGLMGK